MNKIIFTLALANHFMAGLAQTTGSETGANIKELNARWGKFARYAENKQIDNAIREGVEVCKLFTLNGQYQEAFSTCSQMDALIYYEEQQTKKPDYMLRFILDKERLRMYTNLKRHEQCSRMLKVLHAYTDKLQSDSLYEDLLLTEANYYHTAGMTDKSLGFYRQLLNKRTAGKDEQGIRQCYQDMLKYAEEKRNAPLTAAIGTLYASWQDSIRAVKTAQELTSLQREYKHLQDTVEEQRGQATIQLSAMITLGLIAAASIIALLWIATLSLRHKRRCKKLEHSLQIANENNRQKSSFIADISFHIEPALNTMEKAVENISSTEILHTNITALKHLLKDVQTYAWLEDEREQLYPLSETNVNTLCENIMEKAKADFKPEVEAVVNAPRIRIKTNAEEIERLLLHLLRNAAKHTEQGKITLEFKKRSAHLYQYILSDTGCGIASEEIDWLFKPFARTQDLTKGSRFGLPICSLIAYKLNGSLTLDTTYKKGTRFVLEQRV